LEPSSGELDPKRRTIGDASRAEGGLGGISVIHETDLVWGMSLVLLESARAPRQDLGRD
jgi:hypothetical protein